MKPAGTILRQAALRAIEVQHREAQPSLMERAGAAAAELALALIGDSALPPLVVAGPGNNGGDAFVVARRLKQNGLAPLLVFAGAAGKLPTDARAAYDLWIAAGGSVHEDIPEGRFALAVDGLFGIGLGGAHARPLGGRFAALVTRINDLGCPVLALDIPSGLDSETGRILGVAVRAEHTISFIALKPGLLTLDGPDHCGMITVDELGLDIDQRSGQSGGQTDNHGQSIAPGQFAAALLPRLRNSHKGSYGSAGIIGGAPGMAGAALLAGRAALHLGAGRVYLGMLERIAIDPLQPELMQKSPEEVFALASCLAVGPGLGQSDAATALLRRALSSELPLLLDADALNLLAAHPVLQRQLARRDAPTLLTPHPAEAARLAQGTIETIQGDRVASSLGLAQRLHACVVLKGCGSVVALPDGRWFINTSGNPGLASAGTGDVLAGFAVALLAQGWAADQALLAAVHLHGAAADDCVAAGIGPIGLTAGELMVAARRMLNRWCHA